MSTSETRAVAADELLRAKLEGLRVYQSSAGDDPKAVWWFHRRVLEDGRVLYLHPMSFGNVRLSLSPGLDALYYDDQWCYHDHDAAWRAVLGWNGEGDPEGWYRHPTTGRRRPDGDAAGEYVYL